MAATKGMLAPSFAAMSRHRSACTKGRADCTSHTMTIGHQWPLSIDGSDNCTRLKIQMRSPAEISTLSAMRKAGAEATRKTRVDNVEGSNAVEESIRLGSAATLIAPP